MTLQVWMRLKSSGSSVFKLDEDVKSFRLCVISLLKLKPDMNEEFYNPINRPEQDSTVACHFPEPASSPGTI